MRTPSYRYKETVALTHPSYLSAPNSDATRVTANSGSGANEIVVATGSIQLRVAIRFTDSAAGYHSSARDETVQGRTKRSSLWSVASGAATAARSKSKATATPSVVNMASKRGAISDIDPRHAGARGMPRAVFQRPSIPMDAPQTHATRSAIQWRTSTQPSQPRVDSSRSAPAATGSVPTTLSATPSDVHGRPWPDAGSSRSATAGPKTCVPQSHDLQAQQQDWNHPVHGRRKTVDLRRIFDRADANHDGKISRA
jgi:hypothetical protein